MRNLQARFADDQIIEEQNVQIQRARTIDEAGRPVAAKVLFDGHEPVKQLVRRKVCFESNGGIEKAWLRCEAHRLGAVERGASRNVAKGLKAQSGGSERRLRRSGPTGQITAHPDVGRAHLLKGIAPG